MFRNKILLITGGTGTFGNAVLNRFLETDTNCDFLDSRLQGNDKRVAGVGIL